MSHPPEKFKFFEKDMTGEEELVYVPVATEIVSPVEALLIAFWIVKQGALRIEQLFLVSFPVVAT